MLDSFGRGLKMIWASIKMGFQDYRLLLPSILTVFTNFFYAIVIFTVGKSQVAAKQHVPQLSEVSSTAQKFAHNPQHFMQQHAPNIGSLLGHPHGAGESFYGQAHHAANGDLLAQIGLNGPFDMSGFGALTGQVGDTVFSQGSLLLAFLAAMWWVTNRYLEGVTTAMTYSHLTEGPGSGKLSLAAKAVFESLPAILVLGIVTFVARYIAKWLRLKRGTGMFSFGVNFLANIVEVFWTMAGHLILPAIVIEGTSFFGAMKRADRIAQGNLLAIGVGEVGVDGICRFVTWITYLIGVGGGGFVAYASATQGLVIAPAMIATYVVAWASLAIVVTAFSIYIRAAFYTCLYVWAIEAESVAVSERLQVQPPAPLAHALA